MQAIPQNHGRNDESGSTGRTALAGPTSPPDRETVCGQKHQDGCTMHKDPRLSRLLAWFGKDCGVPPYACLFFRAGMSGCRSCFVYEIRAHRMAQNHVARMNRQAARAAELKAVSQVLSDEVAPVPLERRKALMQTTRSYPVRMPDGWQRVPAERVGGTWPPEAGPYRTTIRQHEARTP